MPSRRDFLGLGGATFALLAGCVGESPAGTEPARSPTGADDSTRTAEPTTESTPTADVRPRRIAVTPALVALNSPDSIGTYGESGTQFVVAGVGTRGRLPDREAFSLETPAATYGPTATREVTGHYPLWRFDGPYDPETGGYLLFRVPKPLDADSVALRWPSGEHPLSADLLTRLNRPPTTFAVRAFDAPDSVPTYSEATLTLTVENVGDADGTFVAGLNRTGPEVAYTPVEAVSLDVPADASATWTHSYTPSVPAPEDDLSFDFVLNWRGGTERATVGVEPAE